MGVGVSADEAQGAVADTCVRIHDLCVWPGSGLTSRGPEALSPLATEDALVKRAQTLVSKSPPALALCIAGEQGPREPQTTASSHSPSPSEISA